MTTAATSVTQTSPATATPEAGRLFRQGLWTNNAATVQLLGLCPLLAVSNTVQNALGLGLATLFVLMLSSTLISLLRHSIAAEVRLPVFVLVIASAVTCVELLMQAYSISLYRNLGIFIPLIVTNCLILARAEAFASRQPVPMAIADAAAMGIGFLLVIVVLGGIREWLGISLQVLVVTLPPGAFIVLGLLVACVRGIRTS
ncbi:electron transport complex subunit RsxE [Allohahella marinimesophila]|uniref:Electron transport complex subunit E n=1 Tax=Allohahella marinimesophila TaxID=1054972 RepID=A0ABP7Q5R0_9GAMM